jgi:adenine-specific DNA methylase
MNAFPVAGPPTAEKLRGGYYTPAPLAKFLSEWVGGDGSRLLEPSCGDGAILGQLDRRAEIVGVEIEPEEAVKAEASNASAVVVRADFFEWFKSTQHEAWDGVVGNPPFIRFGNWADPSRALALELMKEAGLKPTKLTNAWVPFVVAATLALKPGGRLGLVLPAELLQVNYAAELRRFLVDQFTELTAVTFTRLVFDGVLQEVILLLGRRGTGPAKIRIVQADDAGSLPSIDSFIGLPHAPALEHETEKWTKYFLSPNAIRLLREVRPEMQRLGELADVDVGLVTGRNQFFVMRPSAGEERSIKRHLAPLVSRSAHLKGIRFADEDFDRLRVDDELCELLALSDDADFADDDSLREYLERGEESGVHEGYKCSIRKQWWVVPSRWTPDAFLLRQIYDHPRIIANLTGATSTDTIHRVKMRNGLAPIKLAAGSINTVTFAFSEILGRSYGGGVLELEPREAEALPIPDPKALSVADVARVDKLLRRGDLVGALDFVDSRLLARLDAATLMELRQVWESLRDRRLARGKSSRGDQDSTGSSGSSRRRNAPSSRRAISSHQPL